MQIGLVVGCAILLGIVVIAIVCVKCCPCKKHATISNAVSEHADGRYSSTSDVNDKDSLSGRYPNRMKTKETDRYLNRVTTKETEMYFYSKETYLDVLHSVSDKVGYGIRNVPRLIVLF